MASKKFFPISILVADDDVDDQFLIQQAVKETSPEHKLAAVHNGLQLMDFLLRKGKYLQEETFMPDLILLDINMPLLDGFEVLAMMRKDETLKNIPTYILSTSRSEQDMKRSLQLGASAFYSKPHQYAQLKGIIGEICQKITSETNNTVS